MNLGDLRRRLDHLAGRVPSTVRVPRLCIVMAGDPDAEDKRRAAEGAGDPVLGVTLFDCEATEPNSTKGMRP
jgi:hypothetical protein